MPRMLSPHFYLDEFIFSQTAARLSIDNTPDALRSKVVFEVADITLVELAEAAFDVAVLSWSL